MKLLNILYKLTRLIVSKNVVSYSSADDIFAVTMGDMVGNTTW